MLDVRDAALPGCGPGAGRRRIGCHLELHRNGDLPQDREGGLATAPSRALLDNGTLQHEASIQTVDIKKTTFEGSRDTELNFRDAWQVNVAGYELAKMLRLNMVPPYVERRVAGKDASVSWWINDAMMEKDRFQKKIQPPQPMKWNEQLYAARIFHELIADTDFNMTNILIAKDWRIWMIDFSRAFRMTKTIINPKQLPPVVTRPGSDQSQDPAVIVREAMPERCPPRGTDAQEE